MAQSVAGTAAPEDRRLKALTVVDRALRRESHVARDHPEILWQQLYNRLQWEKASLPGVLVPALAKRTRSGGAPWLRTRTPFRESGNIARTLAGHDGAVTGCAFGPDGRSIVTAGHDRMLKLWDPESGRELCTFVGHSSTVNACTFSPDGRFLVSAGEDRTLRVWDVESAQPLCTIALTGSLECVALHPSLPIAFCGDSGGSVYLIDLVGIEFSPLIVTATDRVGGLTARCPACLEDVRISQAQLGRETTCPHPGCRRHLRLNPFTIH